MLVSVIVSCIDLYKIGFGCADYSDSTPTFQSFGALVMLVPALEVMLHGYNVIYFDVDMGFVQDPIPFLTAGDADFVTSLGKVPIQIVLRLHDKFIYTVEIRRCSDYPSNNPLSIDWEKIEPNTGVMHLRATPQGISFYRAWLKRIVHFNALNDQKVRVGPCLMTSCNLLRIYCMYVICIQMWDRKVLKATMTSNCNWNKSAVPSTRMSPDSATYCFLPETLFQNGMLAIQCASTPSTREVWSLQMHRHGTTSSELVGTVDYIAR